MAEEHDPLVCPDCGEPYPICEDCGEVVMPGDGHDYPAAPLINPDWPPYQQAAFLAIGWLKECIGSCTSNPDAFIEIALLTGMRLVLEDDDRDERGEDDASLARHTYDLLRHGLTPDGCTEDNAEIFAVAGEAVQNALSHILHDKRPPSSWAEAADRGVAELGDGDSVV